MLNNICWNVFVAPIGWITNVNNVICNNAGLFAKARSAIPDMFGQGTCRINLHNFTVATYILNTVSGLLPYIQIEFPKYAS